MADLKFLPYVKLEDAVDLSQIPFSFIDDGEDLTGLQVLSDGHILYGTLNAVNLELYEDIKTLYSNQEDINTQVNTYLGELEELGDVTRAGTDEFITGAWNFQAPKSTPIIMNGLELKHFLCIKNTFDIHRTITVDDDTTAKMNINSPLKSNGDVSAHSFSLDMSTGIPATEDNYSSLYIHPVTDALMLQYPDGSDVEVVGREGLSEYGTSDQIRDVSSPEGTNVTDALLDRPNYEELLDVTTATKVGIYNSESQLYGDTLQEFIDYTKSKFDFIRNDELTWELINYVKTDNHDLTQPLLTLYDNDILNKDRILLVGQTDASENGLYIKHEASEFLIRSSDADEPEEYFNGKIAKIITPPSENEIYWVYDGVTSPIIDTDDITFTVSVNKPEYAGGSNTVREFDIVIDDFDDDEEMYKYTLIHNYGNYIKNPTFIDSTGIVIDSLLIKQDTNEIKIYSNVILSGKLLI